MSDFKLSFVLSKIFLVLSILSLVISFYDHKMMTTALIFFLVKLLLDKDRETYFDQIPPK